MTIDKILISQTKPSNLSPYTLIEEKYGVKVDFKPFFLINPLTSKEFRAQRIDLSEYTAVVFSARHHIDAFFKLCAELRVKVPQTMKYFCTTEAVAVYLQKHIVFRKRKIFYGTGTPASVLALIGSKHREEKFLIATSDTSSNKAITSLFDKEGLDYTNAALVKSVPEDLSSVDISSYDMIVLYNPADVKSLVENFPNYSVGDTKFIAYGKQIVKAMQDAGLPIEIQAPTPTIPSVARAIELYLETHR